MNSAIERLLNLRVADVMTRSVIQVPAHETMREAAQLLNRHDISGAPVVDEQGRCVGVVSGSDFVLRETTSNTGERPAGDIEHVLVQEAPDEPYHVEDVASDRVSNHMSSAVQTVTNTATLIEAAKGWDGTDPVRLVEL